MGMAAEARAVTRRNAVWAVLVVAVLAVLVAGTFVPVGRTDFQRALQPPGGVGLLGTDHFGRSVARTVLAAAGKSAGVAAVTAVVTTAIGAVVGIAGMFSRTSERVTAATMVMTLALPSLLLTFIIAGVTGGGRWTVAAVVAATHWPIAAQLIGPRVRSEWNAGWTVYDRMLGASRGQLVRWHLLPRSSGRFVASLAIIFPSAVVHEATTAFLGIGVDASAVSLGPLISWGRADIASGAWWALVFPVLALTLLVLPAAAGAARVGSSR